MPDASPRSVTKSPVSRPGQPVVREAHAREPRPRVGLAAMQPRQLRDRERGDAAPSRTRRPTLRRRRAGRPTSRRRAPTRCRSTAWRAARPVRRRRARPSRAVGRRPRSPPLRAPARPLRPRLRAARPTTRSGSCSLRGGVVAGCGARPCATSAPVSASRTSTFVDCVDESTPRTSGMPAPRAQRVPSSSSVTSWSSRSWP